MKTAWYGYMLEKTAYTLWPSKHKTTEILKCAKFLWGPIHSDLKPSHKAHLLIALNRDTVLGTRALTCRLVSCLQHPNYKAGYKWKRNEAINVNCSLSNSWRMLSDTTCVYFLYLHQNNFALLYFFMMCIFCLNTLFFFIMGIWEYLVMPNFNLEDHQKLHL